MKTVVDYILGRLDNLTAWIGFLGLVGTFLGLSRPLELLFVLLIIMPQAQLSDFFKKITNWLRKEANDNL